MRINTSHVTHHAWLVWLHKPEQLNMEDKNMSKNKPIRHGECMLRPVTAAAPADVERGQSVIVGHSETSHHHVLEAPAGHDLAYWTDDVTHELFVELAAPGKLVHKKDVNRHNDLEVAPGTYRVSRKTEYDPFEKVMREVWD